MVELHSDQQASCFRNTKNDILEYCFATTRYLLLRVVSKIRVYTELTVAMYPEELPSRSLPSLVNISRS